MAITNNRTAGMALGASAKGDTGRADLKADFYSTPRIAIDKLLEVEQFGNTVLEPCCGTGAIAGPLKEAKYIVTASDLYDWNYGNTGIDFLGNYYDGCAFDAVCTNPPFCKSLEFTLKALQLTKPRNGKVAMFNRVQWLEGKARYDNLYSQLPFSKLWVFVSRLPRMHRYMWEGKPTTSMMAFAWFCFDWQHTGTPTIGWL